MKSPELKSGQVEQGHAGRGQVERVRVVCVLVFVRSVLKDPFIGNARILNVKKRFRSFSMRNSLVSDSTTLEMRLPSVVLSSEVK